MSSPFAQAVTLVDTMASHVAMLTTTRIHPGLGDTAERADALAQDVARRAIQVEDWLVETRALCETQSRADDILSAAPKPADLEAWHERWSALPEGEQREAEMKAWLHDAAKRQEALTTHTAETITDIPALPEGVCTVPPVESFGDEVSPTESPEKDSADGDRLGDEEGNAPEPGADTEKPVTMSTGAPEAPVTMSTGAPETPVTMSDTAAGTELSSSTATDSGARPSLSQPMGQGTPQVSAAGQPSAAQTGIPVSQQLSQPTQQRGGTGTAPRSPEKRREDQDKRDERDATVQAVSGVGLAGAGGAMTAAAMTSTPSAPSPNTATSGATSTPAPSTPSATPAQGAPPAGGGAGMAGMGRGAPLGSGNGISPVKPVISAEQPTPALTPEEQRLLDAYNKDDKK
ncbi:Uncharacterised protein [Mycobacteroides abscessus subsp. abscessus]|uniref:hypothetical protein n=1 Tax=Mycobacteroides abscessus TaxID=36809 RepID=UPI00092C600F|nr:hypothetical protein [Mycobacteroides abscessus]MDM2173429.1 hypothetical protein [Mycobacteroides abscessus]MDM2176300.1 hypothetical protein [Mycobacteroides abscessus]MDM2204865.1 hypothetical protein [Mycobacteroides abscessus]MDM2213853.1 hypothetical protein [Mycobacteroides abscessus]MDM2215784.1 hypothetical protein [Mycobacteroides abscessus]